MLRRVLIAAVAVLTASSLAAGTIRVASGDAMIEMNKKLGRAFSASHPGTTIEVTGGDSTFTITSLIDGKADIAASARPIKPAEAVKLTAPKSNVIAKDGIVFYVHPANRVKSLSMAQLIDIFSGKITSWKQVGGDDTPIHSIGREKGAGTFTLLTQLLMKGAEMAPWKEARSTDEVLALVAADKSAIGYVGAAHPPSVAPVAITVAGSPMPVVAGQESVNRGTYPFSRIFYYYTSGTTSKEMQQFIDFVRSPEGQKIVVESGFFRFQ